MRAILAIIVLQKILLLPVAALVLFGADLSDQEKRIAAAVDATREDSNRLLERIVDINSGTLNPSGVKRVADVLRPEFEALGFQVRWIPMTEVQRAGHLLIERQGTHGKRVLLVGHMDTVFEPSSPFQKFERSGDTAKGPGAADMKGGLMVILFALKAMHSAGALDGTNITIVLTGDEEKPGEPLSIARRDLIEAGKRSDIALEFEGGSRSEDGREFATIARRSASQWHLKTTGMTAHSSGIFAERVGDGAIYELTRILNAFHDQLREPDLTYNAGVVVGGSSVEYDPKKNTGSASGKVNIIPNVAYASGDIRTINEEQLRRTREKMRSIVAMHLPNTGAEIRFEEGYPSMPPTDGNKAVLNLLNSVNRDLNLETMEPLPPARRGAGDLSFVAPFADSLSGLGAVGGRAHAPGETIDLTRQPIQTKRTAMLLYRLTR